VTIPGEDVRETNTLTWKDLHAAHFAFDSPFEIPLIDDQVFSADEIIRIIPGKRLVAFGTWQEKPVVAKLFFDKKHAKRHMEEDLAGVERLRENKIPTPPIYYYGICKDKRIYILLFKRIFDAKSLHDIWLKKKNPERLLPALKGVTVELATQHVLGILQNDLHLKNFLLTRKKIYTLDGAQIELFPVLLSKKTSMHNFALFLSQLGVGTEELQMKLFNHYASSRGWLLKPEDTTELFMMIKKWNHERWLRYQKKIFRESSEFACMETWSKWGVYDRNYAKPEFERFLHDPEMAFHHATAVVLKAGRSSTVIKVTLDQQELVIKRYNLKNFWHRLRRCLRTTRAATSWRLAQKMKLFGIPTAKPVAFIEKKYFGLRGKSYYVMEYVPGEHGGSYFMRHRGEEEKVNEMVARIAKLLKNLAKLEVTHGDLKITNVLIDDQENPRLIDLDGAAEHAALSSLRAGWRKEIKRFLENFQDDPALQEKFKHALGGEKAG